MIFLKISPAELNLLQQLERIASRNGRQISGKRYAREDVR